MNQSSQELTQGLPYEFAVKNQFTNELQWHSDFCVFFILQGKLNVSLSGRGHLLNQNDLFFLEPYQTFSVITHSDNLRLLHLVISARFIRDLVRDFDAIQFKTHLHPSQRLFRRIQSHLRRDRSDDAAQHQGRLLRTSERCSRSDQTVDHLH